MRAVTCTRYGPPDVLQLGEVETPTPKADEVLVRVYASSVTAGDCELRSFTFPLWIWLPLRLYVGVRRPRFPLGMEFSGVVEALGEQVTRFSVGDAVYGNSGLSFAAHAEYKAVSESGVVAHKPSTLSFEEAAVLPVGGLNALHFMRKANIQPGETVLINGGGGTIGTVAVQLAKHYGAMVTAVDSTEKLEMMRAIGADHVVDYTRENFARRGKTYDVILDVVGKRSFARCKRALAPNGRLLLANPRISSMLRGRLTTLTSDRTVILEPAPESADDFRALNALIEQRVIKPVVDRHFTLEEIVEAHRYVESGQKKGNVAITVAN